jgi:RNA polymerase sigma factor (sigma-70 family)
VSAGIVGIYLSDRELEPRLRAIIKTVHDRAPYVMEWEDLYQEVMLKALVAREQFGGSTSEEFLGWLRTIADHAMIDRLRRAAHRPGREQLDQDVAARVDVTACAEAADFRRAVGRALETLTPLEGAILKARYEAGLSFEQIGRIIERPAATVRQIHHRLLVRLRERMSEL